MTKNFGHLMDRFADGEQGNDLDVQIEVALFKPDDDHVSAHANSAGTKVIYIDAEGQEFTHWSLEWTHDSAASLASLKALAYSYCWSNIVSNACTTLRRNLYA